MDAGSWQNLRLTPHFLPNFYQPLNLKQICLQPSDHGSLALAFSNTPTSTDVAVQGTGLEDRG
jgi:hypothetical protein